MTAALGQLHAGPQQPLRVLQVEVVEQLKDEIAVRPQRGFHLIRRQRHPQALLEHRPALGLPEQPQGRAHAGHRVGQDRGVTDLPGQREGALTDVDAVGVTVTQHVQLGLVGEGVGEQPVVAGPVQDRGRLLGRVFRSGAVALRPPEPRQPPQIGPELASLPQCPAQFDGLRLGGHRGRAVLDRMARDGVLPQQVSALHSGEPRSLFQHQPVMRGGLPVGASPGSVEGRLRPVAGNRIQVAGFRRMVHDARQVGAGPPYQGGEHQPVQLYPPRHRQ